MEIIYEYNGLKFTLNWYDLLCTGLFFPISFLLLRVIKKRYFFIISLMDVISFPGSLKLNN